MAGRTQRHGVEQVGVAHVRGHLAAVDHLLDLALQRAGGVELQVHSGFRLERRADGLAVALLGLAAPVPHDDFVGRGFRVARQHRLRRNAGHAAQDQEGTPVHPAFLERDCAFRERLAHESLVVHFRSSWLSGFPPGCSRGHPPSRVDFQLSSSLTAAPSGQLRSTSVPTAIGSPARQASTSTSIVSMPSTATSYFRNEPK